MENRNQMIPAPMATLVDVIQEFIINRPVASRQPKVITMFRLIVIHCRQHIPSPNIIMLKLLILNEVIILHQPWDNHAAIKIHIMNV